MKVFNSSTNNLLNQPSKNQVCLELKDNLTVCTHIYQPRCLIISTISSQYTITFLKNVAYSYPVS